jgi:hypothetical protein
MKKKDNASEIRAVYEALRKKYRDLSTKKISKDKNKKK